MVQGPGAYDASGVKVKTPQREGGAGQGGIPNKPDLPTLSLSRDSFSIRGEVPGDSKAFVRAELPSSGVVEVTDIFRGGLPSGSGGEFLAQTLKGHRALPTQQLTFKGIINEKTIAAYKAGADPSLSVLGVTGGRALESLGIKPISYSFELVRGKLNLVIKTK